MNDLYLAKLRAGMSAEDLYDEMIKDLDEAQKQYTEEEKKKKALRESNVQNLRRDARASLITAIDKYAQALGDEPLDEKDAEVLEKEIIEMEEAVKGLIAIVGKKGIMEMFAAVQPLTPMTGTVKFNTKSVVENEEDDKNYVKPCDSQCLQNNNKSAFEHMLKKAFLNLK